MPQFSAKLQYLHLCVSWSEFLKLMCKMTKRKLMFPKLCAFILLTALLEYIDIIIIILYSDIIKSTGILLTYTLLLKLYYHHKMPA